MMTGKQGGVQYLNNYKPPIPLQVVKIEGPFNEQGDKITVIEKGKSYIYKATEFNRELKSPLEIKQIKWAMQHNDDNLIFASQARGKQEVTLSISESEPSEKITIYAYFENPIQEASIEVSLKTGEPGYIIISTGEADNWGRIKTYKYSKGILYEEIDDFNRDNQLYKKEPYTGNVNTNVQKIKEDLDILAKNSEGKNLLDFFDEEKNKMSIGISETDNNCNQAGVKYQGVSVPLNVVGSILLEDMSSYIVLAHEMGHAKSYCQKTQDLSEWYFANKSIPYDEIYASHIENKVRSVAGLKLREKYDGSGYGDIMDKEGFSFYINQSEDYFAKPLHKLDKSVAFNYYHIKK